MMPAEELSDDYVASLLAKDAKTSNAKYSSYGLQELLPKRATTNAPKPNTRFLKNIIRETDSHNAALKAKEATESRARLKQLRTKDGSVGVLADDYGRLRREEEPPRKKRRTESDDGDDSYRRGERASGKSKKEKSSDGRSHRSHRRHRENLHRTEENHEEPSHRRHSKYHRRRSRSRSKSRHEHKPHRSRKHTSRQRSRLRSRSPDSKSYHRSRRRRSVSSVFEKNQDKSEQSHSKESIKPSALTRNGSATKRDRSPSPGSDSDPLDSIIGPPPPPSQPPIRFRGRGALASSSAAIDAHFSSTYNPITDIQPDHPDLDADDWDMALEALRDRQKWKQQGAARLREAGFSEDEVKKWEKGGVAGAEKGEEDVRWSGRGEGREWDRGKVVGDDGVETGAEWGRLKGN